MTGSTPRDDLPPRQASCANSAFISVTGRFGLALRLAAESYLQVKPIAR